MRIIIPNLYFCEYHNIHKNKVNPILDFYLKRSIIDNIDIEI